jgi:hypothetical protein
MAVEFTSVSEYSPGDRRFARFVRLGKARGRNAELMEPEPVLGPLRRRSATAGIVRTWQWRPAAVATEAIAAIFYFTAYTSVLRNIKSTKIEIMP